MNKLFITLVLLQFTLGINVFSQKYDLIVTSKGDSIACTIDSISDTNLYFEIRVQNKWIHTYMAKTEVVSYKVNAFNKKEITLKRGTSYIIDPNTLLINQMNRNIVWGSASYLLWHYTTTLNYERIYRVNDDATKIHSFRLGYGIIDTNGTIFLATINSLIGNTKNKFESNIGACYIEEEHSYGPHFVTVVVKLGYRLQSPDKRFGFRTGVGTPKGLYASFGYSF